MDCNTQSSECHSIGSTQSSRSKTDPAWEHFSSSRDIDGKARFTCLYCNSSFKGDGINRMKYHLAGIKCQISQCKKVPFDVRFKFQGILRDLSKKKQDAMEAYDCTFKDNYIDLEIGGEETEEDIQEIITSLQKERQEKGKRKASEGIETYFAPRTTPGSQPSLKSVLAGKQAIKRAHMSWARWFYDACIPFNALQSPYFQLALDVTAAIGPGFKGPSYNDIRVNLLRECKKECQLLVDTYRSQWINNGCAIMADGWTNQRHRTLINFLVYCSSGIVFIKSYDASDAVKDAQTLCNLFSEIVEWVGPRNVVHMVTDNAANYVAAGKLLHDKYDHIYWSRCAAHCLNLILKDISSMHHVHSLALRASKITIFVYNHTIFLSWLRNIPEWREIVRPAVTHFVTTFITLKSTYDHKQALQSLATSRHFTSHRLSKRSNGRLVSSIILDNKFWEDCLMVVKIVGPIVQLLRIVDSYEKPSLGYVYDGMHRTRKGIKNIFLGKKRLYKPYIDIIKERWDKHFRLNIHAAAYFFNPAFIYEQEFCQKVEVMQGLFNLLEIKSICGDETKAMGEIRMYREREGSFGRQSACNTRKSLQPNKWWKLCGSSAPTLQKIVVRILGQTASSSGCERNWSVFERIHTKKRNRLEHQRLNDLVYVTYNLRLKNRHHYKKRSYDPVDYECIDKTDFWIEEEVPPQDFEHEDLDNAIYEENAMFNVKDHEIDDNIQDDNENYDGINIQEMGDLDTMDVIHHFGGSSDCGSDQGLRLMDENDK